MDELEIKGKKYISSKRASELTGYAKDYVGQLARAGKVEATRIGRAWYVNEEEVKTIARAKIQSLDGHKIVKRTNGTRSSSEILYSIQALECEGSKSTFRTWELARYSADRVPLFPEILTEFPKTEEAVLTSKNIVSSASESDFSVKISHKNDGSKPYDGIVFRSTSASLDTHNKTPSKAAGSQSPQGRHNRRRRMPVVPMAAVAMGTLMVMAIPVMVGVLVSSEWGFSSTQSELATPLGSEVDTDLLLSYLKGWLESSTHGLVSFFGVIFSSTYEFFLSAIYYLIHLFNLG